MSQRVSLLSITALFLAVGGSAKAQNEPFAARVLYEAPAGCPTEDAFLRQVSQRAHHNRIAESAEPAREFRAVITQESPNRFAARLSFVDSDSHPVSREVDGSSCSEVAEALVLITALAIDPLLSEPKPQTAVNAPDAGPQPLPPNSTEPSAHPTPRSPNVPEVRDETQRKIQYPPWAVGVSVGGVSGVAPKLAPSLSVFGALNSRNRQSSLRVDVSYAESTQSATNAPVARYRLRVGALEGCPWSLAVASGLRVWPCVAFEAGAFNASGQPSSQLPLTDSTTNLWLAAALDLRAGIDLGRSLQLEVGGKLRSPLIRNNYVFTHPLIEAHKPPALGAGVYVGFAVFFGGSG